MPKHDNFGNTFLAIDNTDLTVMRMRYIAEDMVREKAVNLDGLIKLKPSHAMGLFTMAHSYVVVLIRDEQHLAHNFTFVDEAISGYWHFKEAYLYGHAATDTEETAAAA